MGKKQDVRQKLAPDIGGVARGNAEAGQREEAAKRGNGLGRPQFVACFRVSLLLIQSSRFEIVKTFLIG